MIMSTRDVRLGYLRLLDRALGDLRYDSAPVLFWRGVTYVRSRH